MHTSSRRGQERGRLREESWWGAEPPGDLHVQLQHLLKVETKCGGASAPALRLEANCLFLRGAAEAWLRPLEWEPQLTEAQNLGPLRGFGARLSTVLPLATT